MSVSLLNRFEALEFEDEPEARQVAPAKAAAPAAAPTKGAAPVKTGAAAAKTGAPATQNKANAPRQQGERKEGNNRGPRDGAKRNTEDLGNIVDVQKESRNRNDDRGRRGGRGGGGNFANRGKREFDRRSGTGRRDGEKKETVGQGNWGKPVESNEVEGATVAEALEGATAVAGEPSAEDAAATPAVETPKEDDKFKTLDEYKGTIQKIQAELPPPRKPDQAQWKDAEVLVKDDEEFFSGKKTSTKPRAEKKVKEVQRLDFDPKPYQPERNNSRRRDDRPPRQDDRPRRSGSDRGNRRNAPAVPSLNDQNAFPSLRS